MTRENIDNVNAVIKILIEKPDYEKTVEEKLKEYRQNSSLPGFRPGKAPAGLIKKRFGKAILLDEVNKMLSQNLTKYLVEEKLQILGEPLGNQELQKQIDWDKDEDFEFVFDIALSPEIEISLDDKISIPYYTITVTDEMIDSQIELITSQMGENVKAEEVKEQSMLKGNFIELNENNEEVEEGIRPENVVMSIDLIKDEEIKKIFLGKKTGETVVFNPVTAYENRHEVGHMLNISHEEADELNSNFKFTINEIMEFQKAELNEELYKKAFGEDTEIKTEEDLKNQIKKEIASNLSQSSDRKFALDTRDALIEKINPALPEPFLKRWLKETNREVTEEQIENDFDGFTKDLKWQLIKNSIIKDNELKVEENEVFEFAKDIAYAQYSRYGIINAPDEQLESFAKIILEKPEEKEKLYSKLIEDKIIGVVKEKITLDNKEVTQEQFNDMIK
ncbi:MAG: trigger factor [Prolixibacteraceae bacterium]|nr:trigger factor [Prolixibacteraceae bacterium]